MERRPVIIAGGGPSGMAAALFLITRHEIPVLLLERDEGDSSDPRAATFHPPTLEMLDPSGVTDALLKEGIIAAKWQRRDRNKGLIAEFDLGLLEGISRFPYRLQCEQHKLVRIIRAKLADHPLFDMRLGEAVVDVAQGDDHVVVTTAKGRYEADWLIGADGGRSLVRKSQPVEFKGFTYPERFLVITTDHDYEKDGFAYSNYIADPGEWCAVFKVPADRPSGLWRTVFPTRLEEKEADLVSADHARARMAALIGEDRPFDIVHTNLYTVHQRVASSFRSGRVLLIGDAAHLNNPLGGMGMNFGIHDADNVARSIAQWRETGDEAAIDRFARQRRFAASEVLQNMTIQNKESLEETDPVAAETENERFRRRAADPEAARGFLLRTAMIEGLMEANALE